LQILQQFKADVHLAKNEGVDIIYSPRWFSPPLFFRYPYTRVGGGGQVAQQQAPAEATGGPYHTPATTTRALYIFIY
jgi:hypothetical protein